MWRFHYNWWDLPLLSKLLSSCDTSEWISRRRCAVVFSFSHQKRKRPWASIDSDVWVKCSVCQMNSDSMFITLLHTALHAHAVFKINKQPSFHLPLSWTKIDLTLQIHWLPARKQSRLWSYLLAEITTQIAQYHIILIDKKCIKPTTRSTGMKLASMETIRNWTLKKRKKEIITILYFCYCTSG